MATDIPDNVAQQMMVDVAANASSTNRDGRNASAVAMGVLQGSMARRFDETGVTEGKTAAGILATDVGGPTNPAGKAAV